MTIIKWNNKEYKMPFDADYTRQKADTFKEEIIVKNRFSGEPALLPWLMEQGKDSTLYKDFIASRKKTIN